MTCQIIHNHNGREKTTVRDEYTYLQSPHPTPTPTPLQPSTPPTPTLPVLGLEICYERNNFCVSSFIMVFLAQPYKDISD